MTPNPRTIALQFVDRACKTPIFRVQLVGWGLAEQWAGQGRQRALAAEGATEGRCCSGSAAQRRQGWGSVHERSATAPALEISGVSPRISSQLKRRKLRGLHALHLNAASSLPRIDGPEPSVIRGLRLYM